MASTEAFGPVGVLMYVDHEMILRARREITLDTPISSL